MTTYNTGNPVGSVDVRDLYDNAENLDKFANGTLDEYADRLGVSRQSLQGIRNASQYQVLGPYAAGLQFTALNQVFSYLGEFYAPGPSIVLPYTTTGVGAAEIDNFRSVGDAVLRSDLAATGGATMVGYGAGTVDGTLDDLTAQNADLTQMRAYRDLSPLYLEQFISGFHGRGMLAAEAPSVVTQQALAASAAADDIVISPTDASSFDVGGSVTVLHDNGRYWTYFITAITSNLAILPALKWPASIGNKIERTWYNQAHPGKFYMRQLAQRIAREPQYNMQLPGSGRVIFSQLDSNPTDSFDLMTGFGGGVVSYVDESNLGQGVISKPVESNIGRAMFVAVTVAGQGAETAFIPTNGAATVMLRFVAMARSSATSVAVRIVDDQSRLSISYTLPAGVSHTIPQVYSVPINLFGDAQSFKVQIYTETVPAPDSLILDQFEIFSCVPVDSPAIAQDSAGTVIVGFGDSWISGDEISTPERESILTQLAIELPQATIINQGVGGNTVVDLLARFDADVVPLNPDYVIVNTGTNDSYNPSSGTFFPNSVDNYTRWMNELISRIMSIGARPIIIGLPALAESDGAYSAFALNDRAKTYSRYLYKRLGQRVAPSVAAVGPLLSTGTPTAVIERGGDINAGGSWIKHADGRLECQRLVDMNMTLLTTQVFSFPVLPVVGTPGGFRSLRGLGSSSSLTADAAAALRVSDTEWQYTITASAGSVTAEPMMLTMIGRWF